MKITTSFAFLAAASALALGAAQEPQPQQPSTNLRKGGQQGQAQGKAAPNGLKLKMLIDCFANYMTDASYRPDNSRREGCQDKDIVYCRTDSGHNDHFCRFDGTNHLIDEGEKWGSEAPKCFFNCQMETCNAWDIPHNADQEKCVAALGKGPGSKL